MRQLPGLDTFFEKLKSAIERSGTEEQYTAKWGLGSLQDIYTLLRNNQQGGYDSHSHCMLSTEIRKSVLDIGPGMGFCVFLLAELYDEVYVAEPDQENCGLLEKIAHQYTTRNGKNAGDIVKCINAGLNITEDAVRYWEFKKKMLELKKIKGGVLNYTVKGASELHEVFDHMVDRVYLHKVLSSLSISNSIYEIINTLVANSIEPSGVISWAEPSYVFGDILQDTDLQVLVDKMRENTSVQRIDTQEYNIDLVTDTTAEITKWNLITIVKNGKQ